jgi:UDP-glucose 4-epimerase
MQAFDDYVRGRALRPVIPPGQIESLEQRMLAAARAWR